MFFICSKIYRNWNEIKNAFHEHTRSIQMEKKQLKRNTMFNQFTSIYIASDRTKTSKTIAASVCTNTSLRRLVRTSYSYVEKKYKMREFMLTERCSSMYL